MFPPIAMTARKPIATIARNAASLKFNNKVIAALIFAGSLSLAVPAMAQESVLSPGDAVVSGFAGVKPSESPLPENANPLDHFLIDLDGPSVQILSMQGLGGAPVGQRITPSIKRQIKAGKVGQVFAIELDNAPQPNIYLGATSAFGIQIVGPDEDGNGEPDRLRKGKPGAAFMAGQFGPGPEGNPGTIWRIDGVTGIASAFTTLPGNTGPGIGDIVFDARSGYLFASDLDTGLVHRIDATGVLIDSFDHGQTGRVAKGLDPVVDDASVMNIENPAFDSEDAGTWGFTQAERLVYGMAIHDGRLYYAVAGDQQIWSIGLTDDGRFAGDPRWETDITDLPGPGPITDITFDAGGQMFLAQRGMPKGSYKYGEYADASTSHVLRYRKETPDDPETDSTWASVSDSYAIGLPEKHLASNGGIALGFAHDQYGNLVTSQPDAMIWTSGERLRPGTNEEDAESDLHGLQGSETTLVRPQNTPPQTSYFADYDGYFDDAAKAGHMGDIEIWQPRGQLAEAPPAPDTPPGYFAPEDPPFDEPWDDTPWDETPPDGGGDIPEDHTTNLKLTKTALTDTCFDIGIAWRCVYDVNVQNTSPTHAFNGTIRVKDHFPALPAGSTLGVPETPPWSCGWIAAPDTFACQLPAFLAPGGSVSFTVNVNVPKTAAICSLKNIAEIWSPTAGTWHNTDPVDDIDSATALVPNPGCNVIDESNLELRKTADPAQCGLVAGEIHCRFRIEVENLGPGKFSGPLQVQDDLMAGTTAEFAPAGEWSGGCAPSGIGYLCTHSAAPLELVKNQIVDLWSIVKVPFDIAVDSGCAIANSATIVTPIGGSPLNTNPADDAAGAIATVPAAICALPAPLAAAKKFECPAGFKIVGNGCQRIKSDIVVTPPKPGPQCKSGWDRFANRADIPAGWRKYAARRNGKTIWCGKPRTVVSGPECQIGWTKFARRSQIPSGWNRKRIRKNGKSIWCAVAPAKTCRSIGKRGKYPNCYTPTCKQQGQRGKWPDCYTAPPKTCKAIGKRGNYPNCYTPTCKQQGQRGKWPDCYTVPPKTCKAIGKRGKYPNCYTPTCRQIGKVGRWPNCKNPPRKTCGQIGKRGKYPNCYTPTCKQQGKRGKWPNCYDKPKKTCAQIGKIGKWPVCFKIPTCASKGKVGKWPKCKNPPRKTCKQIGKIGKWPRCYKKPNNGHPQTGTPRPKPKKDNKFKFKLDKKLFQ